MRYIFRTIRRFFASMGLVEQSQVVASTAVIVAMVTIVTTHFVSGYSLRWIDFISVVTVGVIGFFSVYFSLKYGRMLEDQRRELLELNTIAEAVNHSVEQNYVLQSALAKVMELMHADCGWIYLNEDHSLTLKLSNGTSAPFFLPDQSVTNDSLVWVRRPSLLNANDPVIQSCSSEEFRLERLEAVMSIPLVGGATFAGALIIGSRIAARFETKKIAMIQAFGNQISVAINNASLYEKVKQSERQYADLYEHSPDMYHSVNRGGLVVGCNQTESHLLGISKEDIIGKPLISLYPPAFHEQVRSNLKKIFDRGVELKGLEEQIRRSDGTLIDVSVNTSLVYDTNGHPTIARMVLRDITEKKKMEAKLLQAQKIDSIGNLAGGIAHDFNNILTAILGSASIMRRKVKDDDRWTKYIDLIETTSRRGASVARQLLTFARKGTPHVEAVDVNTVLDQTMRLFEATAPKSIHVKCVLSPEPVIVNGDDGQLQQAFLNLCLNARDAMPDGGVLVVNCRHMYLDEEHAQQFAEGKPGNYVMVSVADSGMGIPPNLVNQIFEPFFTTKEPGKGTGLGLSVVYGVVRSHSGYVTVNSEVNSGTIFTLYLPQSSNGQISESTRKQNADLRGGKEKILLIEDEISVGEVGGDILKELGYAIEVVHNGREALQKIALSNLAFDLVILDMNMPRMGGQATFKRIKELHPGLRVLVCSGYSAAMFDDGEFHKSIDGFIQKPYELEEFAQKIRATLDISHSS
ncbi:MAG TPA: PAS domain S-box protein [Bacteroidota bacterium]|nr:PAS domain S-box protein [Bacteroidota bacterium]